MRTAIALAILVLASLAAFGVVKAQKTGAPAAPVTALSESTTTPPARVVRTPPANPVQTVAAGAPTAAPAPQVPAPIVVAQANVRPQPAAAPAPAAQPAAAAQAPAPAIPPAPTCDNPNALGVSRVVEIDTTGGPGFGFEHFKGYDFLKDKEVVLTFDDGPWLNTTPMVLKALADQCVKATFFAIGKHATYYPEILRQVAAQGHTVGSHTWSHQDLSKKTPEEAKEEIEKGVSAVKWALGTPESPFFRFPALRHPPEIVTYLGDRNIAIFSTDFDSFDFKIRKPEQVVKSVMDKVKKHGKGIVLMHDFQSGTAHAVADILAQLKAGGYKIVHLKAKDPVKTLAQYDEMITKEQTVPTAAAGRPMSSVIKTIAGE